MAKRSLTEYKWDAVIDEWLTNGRNAPKAYKLIYPNCNSHFQSANQLFKKSKFVVRLNKRLEQIKQKVERSVIEIDLMYQKAYNLAVNERQPAAAATATTGIARLYGMDKDNSLRDPVQILIIPPSQSNNGGVKQIDSADVTSKELGEAIQSVSSEQLNESEVSNEV